MKSLNSIVRGALIAALIAGAAGVASADDAKPAAPKAPATQPTAPQKPAEPPPTASSGSASAEVHVGTGYEKHAVVGEAATFPAGTKVFVVSLVSGANGTDVKHVWKKDGAEIWTGTVTIGSNKWTTSTRRVLAKAGSYEVDIVGADGAELGKVEFAIQ